MTPTIHPAVFDPTRAAPGERARLAALAAVASSGDLAHDYVLKGGLVLERVYGSPRPSSDLDFDHVRPHPNALTDLHRATLEAFFEHVQHALPSLAAPFGLERIGLRVEKWSELLPTLFMQVVYEEPDGEDGAVEMQVTLCESVCRTVDARIGGIAVQVCSLEDIVGDKLKALLQQARRHKVRHADVYDLWYALNAAPLVVAPSDVGPCLRRKVASWPDLLPLTADRYDEEAVRTFAEAGYRKLRVEQPQLPFPPFDTVWASILAFVARLGLDAAAPRDPSETTAGSP